MVNHKSVMSDQLSYFKQRIERIEDPNNISYADPETGMNIPRRLSKAQIKGHNLGKKPGILVMLLSCVLGAMTLIAARYVRFVLAEIPDIGTEAHTLLIMDFGLAALMAFLIGALIKHKTLRHMMAQAAGIAIMLVAMHNLVWMYPTEFAQVFPQAYVDQVIALTSPHSIYVVGETITL